MLEAAMPNGQLVASALSWYAAYSVFNSWRTGMVPGSSTVAALEGALKEGARGLASALATLDGVRLPLALPRKRKLPGVAAWRKPRRENTATPSKCFTLVFISVFN